MPTGISTPAAPLPVLQSQLTGLNHNEHNPTSQRLRSRPACRLCMARRGLDEPVYCWLPEHVTVCYRHRRWIGPPARTWADQHSLADKPAVIAASHRHGRLHRAHATIEFDLRDARRILTGWARHHSPSHELGSRLRDVEAHIGVYPKIITLAGILAAYRYRIWTSVGVKTPLAPALNGLHRDITRRLNIHDLPSKMSASTPGRISSKSAPRGTGSPAGPVASPIPDELETASDQFREHQPRPEN